MSEQSEAEIQAEIRLALGLREDLRLWRNNRGFAWAGPVLHREAEIVTLLRPRYLEYGLCNGASDLIGCRLVRVGPEHVGRTLAVFTAIEVKRPGKGPTADQRRFLGLLREWGGCAGVAHSRAEAVAIVEAPL